MINNPINLTRPIPLETSRVWRTYHGGQMISRLHGEDVEDDNFPEEWLMSVVAARNAGREHIVEGMSRVTGTGLTLKELCEAAPEAMFGFAHAAKYGASPGVLVKLLDAGERLTLQTHPTRACAMKLFGSPFGKTECWHIIETREIGEESPCIYLGFKEGVTREYWKQCFDTQDIPAMLACLHRIEVHPGDTYIIRGGVPHGIGAGCFLVEIQEPTDYTIRTERVTPGGLAVSDFMCHQGLGFERMFDCFEYDGADLAKTLRRYRVEPRCEAIAGGEVTHIIYSDVTDMFALDLVTLTGEKRFAGGRFSGIYVLYGSGTLDSAPIGVGSHFVIPAACGGYTIRPDEGGITLIRCFGPEA